MRQSSVQRQATVRTNSPQWIWSLRAAGLEAFEGWDSASSEGCKTLHTAVHGGRHADTIPQD